MLGDLIRERLEKKAKIERVGVSPYPARAERTHRIADVRERFGAFEKSHKKVSVVGRLIGLRDQGGVLFADLYDESGVIQLIIKKDDTKDFALWKGALDRGDFVSARGKLITTKRGEKSIAVEELTVLTKSIRPIPTEWYGLEEAETRLRHRYLELLLSEDARELFRKKAAFWESFRTALNKEGFLEVETPALEAIPGGADAEPFKTHHNALDIDFFLRISLELPLKKLLVAGFEKVFEIGRVFRNEGIDREHLQDYTQLEFYWAYKDYNDLMAFVEKLYKRVVRDVWGKNTTKFGGHDIHWGKKWPRIEYTEVFEKATGLNPVRADRAALEKKARELGVDVPPKIGKGRLIDRIYKKSVRPRLIQPAFLINPPVEVEPLAKRIRGKETLVERMQVVACGTELGKGFSELNDPIDQRTRFEEQTKLRAEGDKEAQQLDEEFLEALEYGIPPAAGFGVSERLFAVLVDKPVRETVLFPLLRPKG